MYRAGYDETCMLYTCKVLNAQGIQTLQGSFLLRHGNSCFCASKSCYARWNSCNAIYELSSLESKVSQIVSLSYVLVLKVLLGTILGGVIFRSPVHNAYLNTLNAFACTRESSVFVRNRRALGAVSGN